MKTNKFLLLLISQVSWLVKFVGEAPSFWGFINGKPFCHFAVWPANDVILWHFSLADKEIPRSRVKLIEHISFCPFEQNHQDDMNEPGQLIGLGNWEGWDAQSFDPCRCNRSPYQGPGGVGRWKKTILREILKITSCPDLIAFSLRSLSEAFRLPEISWSASIVNDDDKSSGNIQNSGNSGGNDIHQRKWHR